MKVVILGWHGYIGSQFLKECLDRGLSVCKPGRNTYCDPITFRALLIIERPDLVINCAAYIPQESVSLCDQNQAETIWANVVLPNMLAMACQRSEVPFAHISTGCMWDDGQEHSEDDPPQRAFKGHCGFYVGCKHLSEIAVRNNCEKHYIWRVRLPFDEFDHPRNYLSKLARFEEVWDHENTICHRGDFVKACLDLWQMQASWGTYHVCNPGSMAAQEILMSMRVAGIPTTSCQFILGPQGGSLLSVRKMEAAGVKLRPAYKAIEHSIKNWRPLVPTTS